MLRDRHYGRPRARPSSPLVSVLILLVSLVLAALTGLVVYQVVPHGYTAASSMLVSSQPDVIAAIIAGGARNLAGAAASADSLANPPTKSGLGSLWAILTSREMLVRIANKHKLDEEFSLSEADAIERLDEMTRFTEITDVGVSVAVICKGSRWPRPGFFASSPLTRERARDLSAELANSYLSELEKYVTETNLQQAADMREFLETSKQETQDALQRIEQDLEVLQSSHAFLDPQNKAQQLLERLKSVEPAYAEAGARAEELERMHETAREQLDELSAMRISQEIMARNPLITTLEEKLADLQVELASQKAMGKTDDHRDVAQIKATIERTRQELMGITEEVRQQVSRQSNPTYDAVVERVVGLEAEMVGARARRAHYGRLRDQVRSDLAELPVVAREYVTLQREQDQRARLLDPLAQGLQLVALVEKYSQASRFLRLDTAVPPQRPSSTPIAATVVASLVVLVLGVFVLIAYRRGFFSMLRA